MNIFILNRVNGVETEVTINNWKSGSGAYSESFRMERGTLTTDLAYVFDPAFVVFQCTDTGVNDRSVRELLHVRLNSLMTGLVNNRVIKRGAVVCDESNNHQSTIAKQIIADLEWTLDGQRYFRFSLSNKSMKEQS